MNAINFNLIMPGVSAQSGTVGTADTQAMLGEAFLAWLERFAGAVSGSSTDGATASTSQDLSLMLGQTSAADSAAQDQPLTAANILEALLAVLQEFLDAGEDSTATVNLWQEQSSSAGEDVVAALAVDNTESETATDGKQAAVLWLTGADSGGDDVKEAAVMWLQDASSVVKQASDTSTNDDESLLLEIQQLWDSLVKRLQELIAERTGLQLQASTPVLQSVTSQGGNLPWASAAQTGSVGLPAELLPWLNQGYLALPNTQALTATWQNAASTATDPAVASQLAELADAPESVQWFTRGLTGLTADTSQMVEQTKPTTHVAAVQLAAGDELMLAVTPVPGESKQSVAGTQPGQAVQQQFNVALYSPGEELPLLTAVLTVERSDAPQGLSSAMPWSDQAVQPQATLASVQKWLAVVAAQETDQPLGFAARQQTAVSAPAVDLTEAMPLAADGSRISTDVNALQPRLRGTEPAAVVTVAPSGLNLGTQAAAVRLDTAGIEQSRRRISPVVPATQALAQTASDASAAVEAEAVQSGMETIADELIASKLTGKLALQLNRTADDARQLTAQDAADSQAEDLAADRSATTALPRVKPTAAVLLPQQAAQIAGLAVSGTEQVAADGSQAQPVAFAQLPAQLLQFSSRETGLKPYSGLEYRELASRLIEQANTSLSRGDGLYKTTLELNPPSLGRMSVSIAVSGENVSLQLAVASPVPREQLKGSLNALQRSLEEAGLNVVELQVVTVDPDGRPSRQSYEQPRHQQSDEAAGLAALGELFSQELETYGT